jgi:hypothetical protein
MLLRAIISVSLETHKDFCVGSLHLAIALWVSNGRITNFYTKIFAVLLECAAGELVPIVSDDPVWDTKPAHDELDELDCRLLVDLDHRGHFRPLGEFVASDIEIPVPSDGPGKWPQDVQLQTSEWPRGWDHLQHLRRCVDLLGMKLARVTGLYHLDDVLEGCRPVKSVPKGFIDQRAGRHVIPTLTSMDLCDRLAVLLPGNTPH